MRLMEHGLSTLRKTEPSFPYGLRVLVVDDDPTWLKILEKMLKKCSYEVTTSGLAREALKLLREKKDGFDIVISDVNMPDMDGFKLLEHVGLEMDLPVIMMSVDGETSRVMKGVQHGACDYLLKPIRMKELKNIWQHVLRKRMHEIKDTESHEFLEEMQFFRHGMELYDDGHFTGVGGDQFFLKKRKDVENKLDDKDTSDNFSSKKPRVMWSVDLHQKFVKAVDHIGFDKVGPKKILDLMNIPWLTRENVASHLQKYRLYLSRLQKENELKSPCSGGAKKSDDLPKNGGGNLSMQTSSTSVMQRTDAFVDDLQFRHSKHQAWNAESKLNEVDLKGSHMLLLPSAEPQNDLSSDNNSSDCHSAAARPGMTMRLDHSSGLVVPDSAMNHSQPPVDLTGAVAPSYPWVTDSGDELLDPSFNFDFKPCQPEVFDLKFQGECDQLYQWENCCDYLPLLHFPQKQLIITDAIQPDGGGISSPRQPSVFQNSKLGPAEIQVQSFNMMRNDNNHPLVSTQAGGLELGQVNQVLGGFEPAIGSLTNDGLSWCQGDDHNSTPNIEKSGGKPPGFLEHDFPQLIHHEAPPMSLYGAPRFDLEYLCDCMEYPIIDQGLPIS